MALIKLGKDPESPDGKSPTVYLDDETFTDDPATVKLCTDAFEAVWERAVPHAEYRPPRRL